MPKVVLPGQLNPFWEGLAYDAYIIDLIDGEEENASSYFPLVPLGSMTAGNY
jgi:hypothetical protein